MRKVFSWFLRLFFMVPVALVCYSVASEGLRSSLPNAFAVKVYRLHIPFAGWLAEDELGEKLDLASLMSLLLVVGVCMVTERLVELIILNDMTIADAQPGAHVERKRLFLLLLGPVLLFADSGLFYVGVQKHSGWGSTGTGLPALLATLVYLCLLITAAFVVAESKHR